MKFKLRKLFQALAFRNSFFINIYWGQILGICREGGVIDTGLTPVGEPLPKFFSDLDLAIFRSIFSLAEMHFFINIKFSYIYFGENFYST